MKETEIVPESSEIPAILTRNEKSSIREGDGFDCWIKKPQFYYIYSVSVVLHLATVCWVFGGIIWKWKGKLSHSPIEQSSSWEACRRSVHVKSLDRRELFMGNL